MQVEVNSYEDLGHYLRDVRESMKLDTREVAERLHIRAKYLEAMEAGDMAALPGKVYVRGYLRQYAAFLGLNQNEIGEAFDRLSNGSREVRYFVPEPDSRSYQPGMLAVGVVLVALALIYAYWYVTHKKALPTEGYEAVAPVPEALLPDAPEAADAVSMPPEGVTPAEGMQEEVMGPPAPEAEAQGSMPLPAAGQTQVEQTATTQPQENKLQDTPKKPVKKRKPKPKPKDTSTLPWLQQ